jgi:hypothetical protein
MDETFRFFLILIAWAMQVSQAHHVWARPNIFFFYFFLIFGFVFLLNNFFFKFSHEFIHFLLSHAILFLHKLKYSITIQIYDRFFMEKMLKTCKKITISNKLRTRCNNSFCLVLQIFKEYSVEN